MRLAAGPCAGVARVLRTLVFDRKLERREPDREFLRDDIGRRHGVASRASNLMSSISFSCFFRLRAHNLPMARTAQTRFKKDIRIKPDEVKVKAMRACARPDCPSEGSHQVPRSRD